MGSCWVRAWRAGWAWSGSAARSRFPGTVLVRALPDIGELAAIGAAPLDIGAVPDDIGIDILLDIIIDDLPDIFAPILVARERQTYAPPAPLPALALPIA
jgi:hypothetical protein